MKTYTFTCYDSNPEGFGTQTSISFTTECDTWSGYEGPMFKFFDFLKGCGFVFDINKEIGVLDLRTGEFVSASEEN